MKANTLLLLQSILITLQMINSALGITLHVPVEWAVIITAVVGGFQFYVSHLGNQLVPEPKPEK